MNNIHKQVLLLLSVTLLLLLFGKCTRRPERRLFVCSLDCLPACLRTIHSTILYSTTQQQIGNAATHTNITYSSLSYVGATDSESSTQIDRWTTDFAPEIMG
uniref:Salivary secreted peptide n=1 Tax=Glossina morsitans morsitans TaxID=37546 RepID=A0A1B0FAY0_GLOMM